MLTIKVPLLTQDGVGFAQQFETAIQNELGAQRSELLTKANMNRIKSQFGHGDDSTSAYSLTLHTNGLFTLTTGDGHGGWSSSASGNQSSIQKSIPSYLIPSFGDLLQPSASAISR